MKGEPAKRQRSPFPFSVTVTSSSSSGGGDGGGEKCTEEEEETANCLLMLAQSDGLKRSDKFYVHECKTCNRSFPSFRAVGGHMASHKKPRSAITEHKKPLVSEVDDDDAGIALRVSNKKGIKIHECSICGSDFTSGQALGGHMRRHKVAAASNLSAMYVDQISINTTSDSNKILLDLNLPAPEGDLRDSQFQQAVAFSAPALVDRHY